ncbi:hypothetical protein ACJ73_10156, partial [Blastomyces percursus]
PFSAVDIDMDVDVDVDVDVSGMGDGRIRRSRTDQLHVGQLPQRAVPHKLNCMSATGWQE